MRCEESSVGRRYHATARGHIFLSSSILATKFALPSYRARFDSRDPCRDLSSSDSLYISYGHCSRQEDLEDVRSFSKRGAHVEFLLVAGRLVLSDPLVADAWLILGSLSRSG